MVLVSRLSDGFLDRLAHAAYVSFQLVKFSLQAD